MDSRKKLGLFLFKIVPTRDRLQFFEDGLRPLVHGLLLLCHVCKRALKLHSDVLALGVEFVPEPGLELF